MLIESRLLQFFLWAMILAIAVLLRVILLDLKPVHFDEGINGWFLDQIWTQGFYRYDPENYHGPLYFYVLQLGEVLFGRNIVAMRLVTGMISAAIVLVVLLHSRWFGRSMLWAAALLAVSPGMVFYGRYAIHESLLVLMQAIFIYGFFRWKFEGGRTAVLLMVIGVIGSVATKETFIIFFGTWLIAMALVPVALRLDDLLLAKIPMPWLHRAREALAPPAARVPVRDPVSLEFVLASLVCGLFALAALYSGFFFNLAGLTDAFRSFLFWSQTGTEGAGHEKPFYYWLQLFARYEIPCLLAILCLPLMWIQRSAKVWLLSLVALGIVLAYSIIPYKTPWLVISLILPIALVFGFAIEAIRNLLSSRDGGLVPVVGAMLLALSLFTSVRLNYRDYADFAEPYVYVQTSTDTNVLVRMIESVVARQPQERNMGILILNRDTWPLPWLLGRYPNLRFDQVENIARTDHDVIAVDRGGEAALERLLQDNYYRFPFQLRDAYAIGSVYFRQSLFEPVVRQIMNQSALVIVP